MYSEIIHMRGPLRNSMAALSRKQMTVGFIGGSITAAPAKHNWPEPLMAYLVHRYPDVRFQCENAAIGATGTDLAVFCVERDVLSRNCDLVFVEYAVNDYDEPTAKRNRTREGLLRKLLCKGNCDVVLVYAYFQGMYDDMAAGKTPPSIQEFETMAAHYNLSSVSMGLYAFRQIQKGLLRWEEWLPDGLHPQYRGSAVYADAIKQYLDLALCQPEFQKKPALPPALFPDHWGSARLLPFADVRLNGPFVLTRSTNFTFCDQMLCSAAVGARMSFDFTGHGLSLIFDFAVDSCELRYRIDAGEWVLTRRDRPSWLEGNLWLRILNVSDSLPEGPHRFELEIVHGNMTDCKGSNFRLAFIGIL